MGSALMRRKVWLVVCWTVFTAGLGSLSQAEEGQAVIGPDPELYRRTVEQGIAYLRRVQTDEGFYANRSAPAITAMITTALLRNGVSYKEPLIVRSLKYLEDFVQEDGGIYQPGYDLS